MEYLESVLPRRRLTEEQVAAITLLLGVLISELRQADTSELTDTSAQMVVLAAKESAAVELWRLLAHFSEN